MSRLEKLAKLEGAPSMAPLFAKLRQSDREIVTIFVTTHSDADAGAYIAALNSLFLDKPKPARWQQITEILLACK